VEIRAVSEVLLRDGALQAMKKLERVRPDRRGTCNSPTRDQVARRFRHQSGKARLSAALPEPVTIADLVPKELLVVA